MSPDTTPTTAASIPTHPDASARQALPSASIPRRKRISLACTTCRKRKTRCNGQRPRCSTCVELGKGCCFQEASQIIGTKRGLEDRSDGPLRRQDLELGDSPVATNHEADDTFSPRRTHTRESLTTSLSSPLRTIVPNDVASAVQSDGEGELDAQATATFNDVPDEANVGHFGPTSNHALFRSISNAFARRVELLFPLRKTSLAARSRGLGQAVSRDDARSYVSTARTGRGRVHDLLKLPSFSESAILIDQFFATVGTIWPIVSKSAMLSEMRRVGRLGAQHLTAPTRALLNIIFAHASASSRTTEAQVFYRCSLASLDPVTLTGASVELIQALLLTAIFQQNNQRSISSWTFHALAVKAAFQLGLHSPSTYEEHGLLQSELRKRVWYGLIVQDRLLSSFLGRPCLIPASHNHVSLPFDPQSAHTVAPVVRAERQDGLIYYNFVISLYSIIGSTIQELFEDNIVSDSLPAEELVSRRIKLQWQLQRWRQSVLTFCPIVSEPEFNPHHLAGSSFDSSRFRVLLSLQYYYAELLIDRPILTSTLSGIVHAQDGDQQFAFLLQYAIIVVRSNLQTIERLQCIIGTISKDDQCFVDRNSAWWMCNYTVLTINMHLFCILLLYQACPTILAGLAVNVQDVRSRLEDGLEIMKAISRTSLMSLKARQCLLQFLQVFDELMMPSDEANLPTDAAGHGRAPLAPDFASLILTQTPPVSYERDFSQYITQAANSFLWQRSQDDALETTFGLPTSWNMGEGERWEGFGL